MNSDCLVSVLVLAYNHEKYVGQALDSILAQKCDFDYEIVVGDDASQDNTRSIILEFQKKHPHIINLLPAEKNKGVMGNYRDTLKNCKGKYIAICSADDYWHNPLKLEKQVRFLEAHPDYGIVHTDADYYFQGSGKKIRNNNKVMQSVIPEGDVFNSLIAGRFYIVNASVCFRRDLLNKYVNMDEYIAKGLTYEDLPTWLELSRHAKVRYFDESTATYRILPESIAHTSDISKKLNPLKSHFIVKQYFIDKYHVDPAITKEFLIAYHKKKFDMAYNWNIYPELLESFYYLQKAGVAGVRRNLKKMVLKNQPLYRVVGRSKRLLKFNDTYSDSL